MSGTDNAVYRKERFRTTASTQEAIAAVELGRSQGYPTGADVDSNLFVALKRDSVDAVKLLLLKRVAPGRLDAQRSHSRGGGFFP